ncbi:MAG: 2-phospho-L-lactate transferase CofD family protein [Candidatus Odinarchaeia archaeon]
MLTVFSSGVKPSSLMRGLSEFVSHEKMQIIFDTVLDYETNYGVYIPQTLLGILRLFSQIKIKDTYRISAIMEKLGFNDAKLPDFNLALGVIVTNLMNRGKSFEDAINEVKRNLGVETEIYPVTKQQLRIRINTETELMTPYEYYSKFKVSPIKDIFFDNIDDVGINKKALNALSKSEAVIFAQPDPIGVITTLSLPEVKSALEAAEGTVVAVFQPTISDKSKEVMRALGYSPTIFGLINAYAELVDLIVFNSEDIDIINKADAHDLGVELVPLDLKPTRDKKRVIKLARKVLSFAQVDLKKISERNSKESKTSAKSSGSSGLIETIKKNLTNLI